MIDSPTVIAAIAGGTLAAGCVGLVARPPRPLAGRLRPYTIAARARLGRSADVVPLAAAEGTGEHGVMRRLFVPPVRAGVARASRMLERRTDDALALSLAQAGFVDTTADDYRTRMAAQTVGFAAAGATVGILAGSTIVALGLTVCGAIAGVSRCRSRIDRAIECRRERLRLELYTVNQMLAMHVRTGAGPIQATQRIVSRGTGVAVDELAAVLRAVRSGVAEPDAFRRAAALTPEPAAARTYRLFAAGAERGVDLAGGLRALSDDLRDSRRDEIRATATKRRAAMLVPTIAVLSPVMLLFVVAPLPSIVFGAR